MEERPVRLWRLAKTARPLGGYAESLLSELRTGDAVPTIYIPGFDRGARAVLRALASSNAEVEHCALAGGHIRGAVIDERTTLLLVQALEGGKSPRKLSLAHVELSCMSTTAEALMRAILGAKSIRKLFLQLVKLAPTCMDLLAQGLATNRTLEELTLLDVDPDLSASNWAGALLRSLRGNSILWKLHIGGSDDIPRDVSLEIAAELETNTGIRHFALNECGLCLEGIQAFAKALKGNSTLTYLGVTGNQGGLEAAHAFAAAVASNSTLTALNFAMNDTGDAGALAILKSLERHSSITDLDLRHNGISAHGFPALVAVLVSNHSLQTLSLASNEIGVAGGALEMLFAQTSLTALELGACPITDASVKSFAGALGRNGRLTELDLTDTPLTLASHKLIAEALKKNPALAKFYLGTRAVLFSRHHFGDELAEVYAGVLESNITLQSLSLPAQNITDTGVLRLRDALLINTTLTELEVQRRVPLHKKLQVLLQKNKLPQLILQARWQLCQVDEGHKPTVHLTALRMSGEEAARFQLSPHLPGRQLQELLEAAVQPPGRIVLLMADGQKLHRLPAACVQELATM